PRPSSRSRGSRSGSPTSTWGIAAGRITPAARSSRSDDRKGSPLKRRSRAIRTNDAETRSHNVRECERRARLLDRQMRILEGERQKLSAVVSHADAGFLVFDESLRVTWANNIFASRFCSSENPGSVLGSPCRQLLCQQAVACEECPAARPFRSGIGTHHELRQDVP